MRIISIARKHRCKSFQRSNKSHKVSHKTSITNCEKLYCKMLLYVTRFFSKSCKILMFYSFKAFNDRQFHLKVRLTNGKNVLKCDNGIRSKEFQLQKYLFDHYMIWKIDCFLFTSLWSTNKTYFWKLPLPTTSLSLPPRLLLLYWLSSFSNKNQTVSINNFFSWRNTFQSYICATIVHPRESPGA